MRQRRRGEADLLHFFADFGAESPLWRSGAMVTLESLPLSESLRAEIAAWVEEYQGHAGDDREWQSRGTALFAGVQAELAPSGIHVVWDFD